MRRHAKASTAGSTQRQARGLGRFQGAIAARGASPASRGSGALKSRRPALSAALFVALFTLVLGQGSAFAAAPTISSTSVSSVTTKTAQLQAAINPGGEATTYHFEYGPGDCASSPCTSFPAPDAGVGSGSAAVKISKEITGLAPGATYHYRTVATNATGTVEGPDMVFHVYTPESFDTGCPNQQYRYGPAAALPDCRAYEMVSPIEKNGSDIAGAKTPSTGVRAYFEQTVPSGDKITYTSPGSFAGQVSNANANQYLAARTPTGWSTAAINPPRGPSIIPLFSMSYDLDSPFEAFSEDLSSAWVKSASIEPLVPNGLEGFGNLYRRDNVANSYEALTIAQPSAALEEGMALEFRAASADGKHQVFEAAAAMTANAPATEDHRIYDFSNGELHLVSVLPDGTVPNTPSLVGTFDDSYGLDPSVPPGRNSREVNITGAVSDDGSRVFWSSNTSGNPFLRNLYMRENPAQEQSALNGSNECTEPLKACTIPVSEAVTSGDSEFWAADPTGSTVVFTATTSTVTTIKEGDLYEFDVDTRTPTLIAHETQGVLGASDNLDYLYFVSKESLASGSTAGQSNLYLDHNGAISFIATFSSTDLVRPGPASLSPRYRNTRVTPDGRHIAFMSNSRAMSEATAGYDNTDASTGEPDMEVYTYEVGGKLICVSCNPSGARPRGERLPVPYYFPAPNAFPSEGRTAVPDAAWIPTWGHETYASRVISNDGTRIYFNSFDPLLPRDSNGKQDVYQWQAEDTGNCHKVDGCVSLISTGDSAEESEFVDASSNGDDVFFYTLSSIDPHDPGLIDIYDARVGGGLVLQRTAPECVGDACESAPEAPRDATPASASFHGQGNPTSHLSRSCGGQAKRAARYSRLANRLRRAADHAGSPAVAEKLRQRSVRVAETAKELNRKASRCRRANRRAER